MDIMMCGIRHKDIALREQVNFTDIKKMEFQQELRAMGIKDILILSTCNRSEVLCIAEIEQLRKVPVYYQRFFSIAQDIHMHYYEKTCAVKHFYRICAGLDSILLGEDQIFHQVKEAYRFACDSGCAGKPLHTFLQKALHFTKKVKEEVKLSEHPMHSSYVAIKALKQMVCIQDKSILLSGSGEIIQACIPYLIEEKPAQLYMVVRSMKKCKQLQVRYPHIQFFSFEQRYELWKSADIIISATSSPHVLYQRDAIGKDQKERWILDLALPRDIDEQLRCYENLHIYDIDQLQKTLQNHAYAKEKAIQEAEKRIDKEVEEVYVQLCQSTLDTLIADFQQHLLSMSANTYHLLENKLSISPHEQRILKKTLDYSFLRFLQDWLSLVKECDIEKQALIMDMIKRMKGGNA